MAKLIVFSTFILALSTRCGGAAGQRLNSSLAQYNCTPVDNTHPCYSLPGRNSFYQYPQKLPATLTSNNMSLDVGHINLLLTLINNMNPPSHPDCVTMVTHTLCLVLNPPCNKDTGLLIPICDTSCFAFCRIWEEGGCRNLQEFGDGLLNSSFIDTGTVSVLIKILLDFECAIPTSYYFYDDLNSLIDSSQCTDLFSSSKKESRINAPYNCVEAPLLGTECENTPLAQYNHYIPLEGRDTGSLLHLLNSLKLENVTTYCTEVFTFVSCFYIFPPCDPTKGYRIEICSDLCNNITSLIKECGQPYTESNALAVVLDVFNCSEFQFVTCGFPETMSTGQCIDTLSYSAPIDAATIAGGTVAGVLLMLVATFSLVIVFKTIRKRKANSSQLGYKGTVTLRRGDRKDSSANKLDDPYHLNELTNVAEGFTLSKEDHHFYKQVFSATLVSYSLLTVEKEIGQGAFGKVYLGRLKLVNNADVKTRPIAIKTIKNLTSENEVKAFFEESLVMKDFKHSNILGLTGVCFDTPDGMPYILLPYMANGSLKDYLKGKRTHVTNVDILPEDLSLSTLVRMCMDVASGMEYLAMEKFVHRDLAARNCMVDTQLAVKLGDFGLARDIYSSNYYRAKKDAKIPVKWMAPETLIDAISNEKTDVWSYGVTCWEVFSLGRAPYPGIENQDIIKYITNDSRRLEKPSLCPVKLYSLVMGGCWELLPERRPTFSQLVVQLQEYWEEEHAYVVD